MDLMYSNYILAFYGFDVNSLGVQINLVALSMISLVQGMSRIERAACILEFKKCMRGFYFRD